MTPAERVKKLRATAEWTALAADEIEATQELREGIAMLRAATAELVSLKDATDASARDPARGKAAWDAARAALAATEGMDG